MVIFKLYMDNVKIGWVRVIYDGSGNFQVFSGFLWPKLRVPHCTIYFNSLLVCYILLQFSSKYRRGNFAEIARRYLIFFPLLVDI